MGRKKAKAKQEPEDAPADVENSNLVGVTDEWRRLRVVQRDLRRALRVLNIELERGPIAIDHFIRSVKDAAGVE